ncbi:hypothetical protein EDB84DRAFT_1440683 [Lactarius hengduanensis]|nr:hypothetical protein EDB84DRAFT_1440683 [Lactarius hengduanensis]
MDSETLRFRILEADVRAQQKRADEYRELLLSLVEESASTSLSTVPQPQPIHRPSPSPVRDPGTLSLAPAPARPANPNRGSPGRREIAVEAPVVVTGALAQLRPARSTSVALTIRPAPYRRAESVHHGGAQRLTRSQTLAASGRNEQPGGSSSQASTILIGSTHQNDSEVANDVPDDANTIQDILDSAGLTRYSLSWGESERANMTPSIRRSTITRAFGGDARREWFECNRRPNYKHFFCADARAQPFAPTRVGDRGLMLFSPAWIDAASDEEGQIFHGFVSTSHGERDTKVNYIGDYTKVPLLQTHVEWSLLPLKCQRAWLNRLSSLCLRTPMGRALHIRIKLREILKREPSVAEVQGRMQDAPAIEVIQWQKLSAAFKSGKEKIQAVGIKCGGYNAHLASIILMENNEM